MFKNFHKNKYNSGITLIELLVVIAIFMVISSITIFNYGGFNSSLSIQNLADDIALSIRKAQGYAIGVRGYGGSFSEGYGIHFTANPDKSNLSAGSNKSFVLFTNINSNTTYNYDSSGTCGTPTSTNECLEVLNITSADEITEIYLSDDTTPIPSTGVIDILFKRPNPEPTFCYRSDPERISCEGGVISSVKIRISNVGNPESYKTITISINGQISVS